MDHIKRGRPTMTASVRREWVQQVEAEGKVRRSSGRDRGLTYYLGSGPSRVHEPEPQPPTPC